MGTGSSATLAVFRLGRPPNPRPRRAQGVDVQTHRPRGHRRAVFSRHRAGALPVSYTHLRAHETSAHL
eukprot:12416157-Alexandrium_andersonii.AAC.1